ncbi:hypothetical protein ISS03_04680, partial [Patescibacteria group bacterium]|nr:hypothetical protein [Patescibacteria group bacterium]
MQIKKHNYILVCLFLCFALVNIARATDVGENIETEGNMNVEGTSSLTGNTGIATSSLAYPLSVGNGFFINLNGDVTSASIKTGNVDVSGNVDISGTLGVFGKTTFSNDLVVGNISNFNNSSNLNDIYAEGNLEVDGNIYTGDIVANNLTVSGIFTQNSDLNMNGSKVLNIGNVNTNFTASGGLNLKGDLIINTNKFSIMSDTGNTVIAGILSVSDSTALNGGLTIGDNKFVVESEGGNTNVAGTLDVDGAVNLASVGARTNVRGILVVDELTTLDGGLTMNDGKFSVAKDTGDTSILGTLNVGGGYGEGGMTYSNGTLSIDGDLVVTSGEKFVSDATLYTGDYEISDTLRVGVGPKGNDQDYLLIGGNGKISNQTGSVVIDDNLDVIGSSLLKGNLEVIDSQGVARFSVAAGTGNVTVGSLASGGSGDLNVGGDAVFENNLRLKKSLSVGPGMRIGTDNAIKVFANGATSTLGSIAFNSDGLSVVSGDVVAGTKPLTITSAKFNLDSDGNVTSGSIIPNTLSRNLGSSEFPWKDLWVSGGTIYMGAIKLQEEDGDLALNGTDDSPVGIVLTGDMNVGNTSITGTLDVTGATTLNDILTVTEATDPNILIQSSTDDGQLMLGYNTTGDYAAFSTKDGGSWYGDTMVLKAGNVGIGTTNPGAELDVVGDTIITGNLSVADIIPNTTGRSLGSAAFP